MTCPCVAAGVLTSPQGPFLKDKTMSLGIFGDSIAVGISTLLKASVVVAHIGWPSATISAHTYTEKFDTVIFSAGSNDPGNPQLRVYLEIMRSRVKGSHKIIWILPHNAKAAKVVETVAAENGDKTIAFHAGRDGVHPESYQALVNGIKELM